MIMDEKGEERGFSEAFGRILGGLFLDDDSWKIILPLHYGEIQ